MFKKHKVRANVKDRCISVTLGNKLRDDLKRCASFLFFVLLLYHTYTHNVYSIFVRTGMCNIALCFHMYCMYI